MPAKQPGNDGGYNAAFLGSKFRIKFPVLNADQKKDLLKFNGSKFRLDYIHYSAVMSKTRRLAFFTAVNIDGNTWQDNSREGSWDEDPRIAVEDQLGRTLYSAKKSDFDKGHLVRREDPEWGTKDLSLKAGANTFWYPNAAPQHEKLNRRIWGELEANILHLGADEENLKVNVFTGPVLAPTDGMFVTKVKDKEIQIPNLYWKVVVWTKSNGKAYAVGFLMSQEKFLIDAGIIKKPLVVNKKKLGKLKDEDIFEHLEFKDGKTYQVKLDEIEKLTGLSFDWPGVVRPFRKKEPAPITGTTIPPSAKKKKPEPGIKRNMKLKGLTL
jgi:endonuclease G